MVRKHLSLSLLFFICVTMCFIVNPATAYAYSNIAQGKPYNFSATDSPHTSYPDTNWSELTDGTFAAGGYTDPAWQCRYYSSPGSYYITVNFRVPSTVNECNMRFLQDSSAGIYYPASVRYYCSYDGIYYTLLGEGIPQPEINNTKKYKLTLGTDVSTLFIRAYVCTPAGNNFTDEIEVNGNANYPLPTKLSTGKAYTSSMPAAANFPDTGNFELTDNVFATGDYTDSAWSGRYMGEAISSYTQTMDLGSVKNVSEAVMNFYDNAVGAGIYTPGGVRLSYSTDNINYTDLNFMSWESCRTNGSNNYFKARKVLPYTISARYIKALIVGRANIFADEWEVYGQTTAIPSPMPTPTPAPDSSFTAKSEYTNVAKGKAYTTTLTPSTSYPDTNSTELTDGKFGGAYTDSRWVGYTPAANSKFEQTVDLAQSYSNIQGVGVEFLQNTSVGILYPNNVGVSISTDGTNYTYIGEAIPQLEVGSKRMFKLSFSDKTARYIRLHIYGNSSVFEDEIQVYNGDVQKPVLDGGWINLPLQDTSTAWYNVIPQAYGQELWDKELQMMKNLGMRYIILGQIADTEKNITVWPTAIPGYSQVTGPIFGYAVNDPIETIMNKADALGMKVLVGTGSCAAWYSTAFWNYSDAQKNAWIDDEVSKENTIIQELYNRYGNHSSFYGFALSTETADDYLSNGKWVYTKRMYKGMSDYIRNLSSSANVAIVPACWETVDAASFANDMYSSLYNDGARPVADIVIMQDGIGAGHTGNPPNWFTYEERLQTVPYMLRSMGVQFWNDNEFYQCPNFNAAREEFFEKSLNMESKYSNINLMYDITDYFDPEKMTMDAQQTYADYVKNYNIDKLNKGYLNISLNKTYTSTMAANPSYPDTGGTELTDGKLALYAMYGDSKWQGRYSGSAFNYSFTIDLGSNNNCSMFVANFLKQTSAGIHLPTSVAYSYSIDGSNYTNAGNVNAPALNDDFIGTYRLTLNSGVTARYVKITVSAPSGHSFIDEFSVLN